MGDTATTCDANCSRTERHAFEVFCAEQVFRIKHPDAGGAHHSGVKTRPMDHYAYLMDRRPARA